MPTDRRELRRQLFQLASEQGGYFTAAQARRLGYSYQAQAHHVRAGNWTRIERGIFQLREHIAEPHDDLARWTLWSAGRGVVSHETALSVHGIGEFESPRTHLTVPRVFRKRDDALVLHRLGLADNDVEERQGFKVTTPLRSIIDVAAVHPDTEQLARAIEECLARGLVTRKALRSRSEAIDASAALRIERALHLIEVP